MAKFNEVQKRRRAVISERKRNIQGDPVSKKLKRPVQLQSVSGKRQRKLLKKWRRDQKDAVEKGLISLTDVDMTSADGDSSKDSKKNSPKFLVKKTVKFNVKQKKNKGKKQSESSKPGPDATSVDAMME